VTLDGFIASIERQREAALFCAIGEPDPLDVALAMLPSDAVALEFGVFRGESLSRIARALPNGTIFGFDSFLGLPSDWRAGFPAGMFSTEGNVPETPGATIVPGLFADTLPRWLDDHEDQQIHLIHIDCDIYESTACVLENLAPRLVATARNGRRVVLVFDELIGYPGFEVHEIRALWECCETHSLRSQIVCSGGIFNQAVALTLTRKR